MAKKKTERPCLRIDAPFDEFLDVFRKLTGREPDEENVEEAKELYKELESKRKAEALPE